MTLPLPAVIGDAAAASAPAGPACFVVENPATLEVLAHVPEHGAAEARLAVDRAHLAQRAWAQTSPRDRSDVLRRCYDLMIEAKEELAELVSSENGKSLADAAAEISYAAEFLRWFSEEAVRPSGDYGEAPVGGTRTIVTCRPVGVAALITPWNFPAAMATRKLAPALAAGCAAVLKPAAETPLTAVRVQAMLREAGLPDGVVEVVTTTNPAEVVGTWMDDPRVRKISFTGSTAVGKVVLRQAAERIVNPSMELGGNAPFVVTSGADLDEAVTGAMAAKFRGGGQACTAANRFFVHESVAFDFTARLASRVEELTVGAAAQGADIGPLISRDAVRRVEALIDRAIADGARVVTRAPLPALPGYFVAPTLLAGVPADARILAEEIFAPVVAITTWRDEDDLLARVNDAEHGLAAYVYDKDLQRALRLAEGIEAGMVGVNRGIVSDPAAPFGGVKQSGLGREGAWQGLADYQETQYFSVAWPDRQHSASTQPDAGHRPMAVP